MKTCPSCKETYGDDKNFCRKCGAAVSAASTDRPMSPEFLARRHIFEAKIAKDPEATELLTSYGDYLLSESLVDDAIVQYIRALDTVPNDEEIGLRLVKAYHLGRHYHDKAIANALIFLDSHPDSVRLRDELASLYLELGKFPSAAQLLLELTKLEPSNPDHFVRRLDVLRKIPDCQDRFLKHVVPCIRISHFSIRRVISIWECPSPPLPLTTMPNCFHRQKKCWPTQCHSLMCCPRRSKLHANCVL